MSENFEKRNFSIDHLLVANKLFDFYKENGFLEEHKELFWRQWIDSFWFSYEHSNKDYYPEIKKEAIQFLEVYYEKYQPQNKELQQRKNDIIKALTKLERSKNET